MSSIPLNENYYWSSRSSHSLRWTGFFSDYQTLQFFVFTVRLNLFDNA